MVLNFVIVSGQSTFRGILRISFLVRLGTIALYFHLKVMYLIKKKRPVLAATNEVEAKRIKEVTQRYLLVSTMTSKAKIRGKMTDPRGFDLDDCEDEVRPMPDGNFEFVQLKEDPTRSVKIGVDLPLKVRTILI